jgi:uncharacterized membrane protein YdjX (TVP38/TMEM64 family)
MSIDEPEPQKSILLRFLPLLVIVAVMALAFGLGLHKRISLEALIENEAAFRAYIGAHWFLALAGFAALYAALVALSLPVGAVLTITGGYLFGLSAGATATVIGATIGASLIFLIARSSLGDSLARKLGPALESFKAGFQKDATSYLLFLRFAPIFPFALVNIAPALLGARFWTYFWTTALGILPGTLAFTSIGSGLGSVIAAQIAAFRSCKAGGATDCHLSVDPGMLITKEVLTAFALLATVSLLPIAIKRFSARKSA